MKADQHQDETRVLYNAQCPVCHAEIAHYADYSAQNDLPIRFDDLNAGALDQWGLSPEDAARRLHVLKGGALYSGIPAFMILWQEMPRYRWLARVVALPGVNWLAVKTYDHILAPSLYRWFRRRQKHNGAAATRL